MQITPVVGGPTTGLSLGGSFWLTIESIYLYRPVTPFGPTVKQFYVSDWVLGGVEVMELDDDGEFDLVAIGDDSDDLDLLYQIPFLPTRSSTACCRAITTATSVTTSRTSNASARSIA